MKTLLHRALLTAAAVLACGQLGLRADGGDLKFGFTPVLGQSQTRTEFEPLMAYLSSALGRGVVLYVAKDYGDLRTQMEAGSVDIGSFSPFAYVDAARAGRIRIIAQSLIEGSGTYRGLIIIRKDSGLGSLADLGGKRFAFVDPKSASGYVYPRAMLLEHGIRADTGFSQVIFAGDHNRVIAAVLDRKVEAGAIYDGAIRVAKAAGMHTEKLAVLASTDPIPHDAIAVRVGLDAELSQRIQAALVGLSGTEAGRKLIARSTKGLTGFAVAADDLYDPVRRTARTAGM
jgi:phosphate/phosphite/phosphonate ABC transporter binding protein